ncbi:Plasmid pRiA4b ORF-3-like protein [mine drainage metagenome]|uniref:Plasmid pRiA4b ORF-3-like protein n=1 Tax=mine drainage metagenome TaxID=410659 RepID=T1C0S0_9ZZZZ
MRDCKGRKRNCPPGDCCGTFGCYEVLKKAMDPEDPEHDETVEWLVEYNPEEFGPQYADAMIRNYKDAEKPF